MVVGFFAHWCHHCKVLLPKWKDAMQATKAVLWCEMDCSDSKSAAVELFRDMDLRGFPAVLLFDGGAKPRMFPNRGKVTTASDLVRFVMRS